MNSADICGGEGGFHDVGLDGGVAIDSAVEKHEWFGGR
jgi:hypothetical protein